MQCKHFTKRGIAYENKPLCFFTLYLFGKPVRGFRLAFAARFVTTLSTNNCLRPYHNGYTPYGHQNRIALGWRTALELLKLSNFEVVCVTGIIRDKFFIKLLWVFHQQLKEIFFVQHLWGCALADSRRTPVKALHETVTSFFVVFWILSE